MKYLRKFFSKIGRYRIIPDRRTGEDYLHRYYLFLKDRVFFPFNIVLHKIVRSDDPVFHDHPWPYCTIILSGGYYEHTPVYDQEQVVGDKKEWKGPGSIIIRNATEYHWLELDADRPAITLFLMGPQQREWGFLVNNVWIKHDTCIDNWSALVTESK